MERGKNRRRKTNSEALEQSRGEVTEAWPRLVAMGEDSGHSWEGSLEGRLKRSGVSVDVGGKREELSRWCPVTGLSNWMDDDTSKRNKAQTKRSCLKEEFSFEYVICSHISRVLLLIDSTHIHSNPIIKSWKFSPLIKEAQGLLTMAHNNVVFLSEINSLNLHTRVKY